MCSENIEPEAIFTKTGMINEWNIIFFKIFLLAFVTFILANFYLSKFSVMNLWSGKKKNNAIGLQDKTFTKGKPKNNLNVVVKQKR